MKMQWYVYTGTGNSLWTARQLALELKEVSLHFMPYLSTDFKVEADIDEKPTWLHRCEQCFACLQWCPKEAIQSGKKTVKYPRYHHPEIRLEDMFEQAKTNKG